MRQCQSPRLFTPHLTCQFQAIPSEQDLESTGHTGSKKARPELWQRNIMKQRRQYGMSYIGRKINRYGTTFRCEKQLIPARKILNRCSCKRSYSCHTITDETRKKVFEKIWSMDDDKKRQYVRTQVDSIEPLDRRSKAKTSRRKRSLIYHLTVGGERKRVCQEMFLATTGLRKGWVHKTVEWTTI